MECDAVGDKDNVDWIECCFCFGFGEEVFGEAAVAVIVGYSGLAAAESVIRDKIDADDDDDVIDVVVLFWLRISTFSFYIIYIIIINKNKNTYHDDWGSATNDYLNIFMFIYYYNINYIKRECRYSLNK